MGLSLVNGSSFLVLCSLFFCAGGASASGGVLCTWCFAAIDYSLLFPQYGFSSPLHPCCPSNLNSRLHQSNAPGDFGLRIVDFGLLVIRSAANCRSIEHRISMSHISYRTSHISYLISQYLIISYTQILPYFPFMSSTYSG